jgi:hypothetical protein
MYNANTPCALNTYDSFELKSCLSHIPENAATDRPEKLIRN